MSKSELKRLCTQDPIGMAEAMVKLQSELAQLKQELADEQEIYTETNKALNHVVAELAQLRQREMVLYEALERAAQCIPIDFVATHEIVWNALNAATPQTADQVLRWHVEWMRTLPVECEKSLNGLEWQHALTVDLMPNGTKLVAIPTLPESKPSPESDIDMATRQT